MSAAIALLTKSLTFVPCKLQQPGAQSNGGEAASHCHLSRLDLLICISVDDSGISFVNHLLRSFSRMHILGSVGWVLLPIVRDTGQIELHFVHLGVALCPNAACGVSWLLTRLPVWNPSRLKRDCLGQYLYTLPKLPAHYRALVDLLQLQIIRDRAS